MFINIRLRTVTMHKVLINLFHYAGAWQLLTGHAESAAACSEHLHACIASWELP